jgi:hypothetical protein
MLLVSGFISGAQASVSADSVETNSQHKVLRIFIDCDNCDIDYWRNEILFVNHVRDPNMSQVHLHITSENTGSRGRLYKLDFIGREDFEGQEINLSYQAAKAFASSRIRNDLLKIIQMGLAPFVSQVTPLRDIDIELETEFDLTDKGATEDPWNAWVFSIESTGEIDAEESNRKLEANNSIKAEKVVVDWKARAHLHHELEVESFQDDEEIESTLSSLRLHGDYAKTMGKHLSLGIAFSLESSSYSNIDLGYSLTPLVEYNIWPWSESDERMFTIAYTTGFRLFNYNDTTIYDQISESLAFEHVKLGLRLIRPWGDLEFGLGGSHYFKDFGLNNIEFDFKTSYRIAKGLELVLRFDAESIHDQINLARGDATLDEILLRRKQLATTYDISTNFGISYTFGSIYSNIVNRRLY